VSRELRPNLAVHLDGVYTNHIEDEHDRAHQHGGAGRDRASRPDVGRHPAAAGDRRASTRGSSSTSTSGSPTATGTCSPTRSPSRTTTARHRRGPLLRPRSRPGPGNADRRHVFMASWPVMLPFEITLGAVYNLRSSSRSIRRAGRDLSRDGTAASDYVPGTTRNMGNRDTARMLELVNDGGRRTAMGPLRTARSTPTSIAASTCGRTSTSGWAAPGRSSSRRPGVHVLGRGSLVGVGSGA
jgi:hypothetical protein